MLQITRMMLLLLIALGTAKVSPAGSAATGPRTDSGRAVMYVLLPAPFATCKCTATDSYSPANGTIPCPNNPQQVAVQIIWETPTPGHGSCTYVPPDGEGNGTCSDPQVTACTLDVKPLDVTLYNCWSSGRYVKATGLQSGQWFWFTNDSDVEFDPNLTAECIVNGPKTAEYTIEFSSSSTGPADATFKITLTCGRCGLVN